MQIDPATYRPFDQSETMRTEDWIEYSRRVPPAKWFADERRWNQKLGLNIERPSLTDPKQKESIPSRLPYRVASRGYDIEIDKYFLTLLQNQQYPLPPTTDGKEAPETQAEG